MWKNLLFIVLVLSHLNQFIPLCEASQGYLSACEAVHAVDENPVVPWEQAIQATLKTLAPGWSFRTHVHPGNDITRIINIFDIMPGAIDFERAVSTQFRIPLSIYQSKKQMGREVPLWIQFAQKEWDGFRPTTEYVSLRNDQNSKPIRIDPNNPHSIGLHGRVVAILFRGKKTKQNQAYHLVFGIIQEDKMHYRLFGKTQRILKVSPVEGGENDLPEIVSIPYENIHAGYVLRYLPSQIIEKLHHSLDLYAEYLADAPWNWMKNYTYHFLNTAEANDFLSEYHSALMTLFHLFNRIKNPFEQSATEGGWTDNLGKFEVDWELDQNLSIIQKNSSQNIEPIEKLKGKFVLLITSHKNPYTDQINQIQIHYGKIEHVSVSVFEDTLGEYLSMSTSKPQFIPTRTEIELKFNDQSDQSDQRDVNFKTKTVNLGNVEQIYLLRP